jgi:hypothetical protein
LLLCRGQLSLVIRRTDAVGLALRCTAEDEWLSSLQRVILFPLSCPRYGVCVREPESQTDTQTSVVRLQGLAELFGALVATETELVHLLEHG